MMMGIAIKESDKFHSHFCTGVDDDSLVWYDNSYILVIIFTAATVE